MKFMIFSLLTVCSVAANAMSIASCTVFEVSGSKVLETHVSANLRSPGRTPGQSFVAILRPADYNVFILDIIEGETRDSVEVSSNISGILPYTKLQFACELSK